MVVGPGAAGGGAALAEDVGGREGAHRPPVAPALRVLPRPDAGQLPGVVRATPGGGDGLDPPVLDDRAELVAVVPPRAPLHPGGRRAPPLPRLPDERVVRVLVEP